jgi:hypothetical protein
LRGANAKNLPLVAALIPRMTGAAEARAISAPQPATYRPHSPSDIGQMNDHVK